MRHRVVFLALLLTACSKPPGGPAEPAGDAPAGADAPTDAPGDAPKAALSASECEAQGGKVVGDIGDGAIHKPDYRCPDSGEPPLGPIAAPEGGPIAVEGSVCCA